MKFWLIVNIAGAEEIVGDLALRADRRPMWLHTKKSDAEIELLWLQKTIPGGEFHLMESVAWAQESPSVPGMFKIAYVPA